MNESESRIVFFTRCRLPPSYSLSIINFSSFPVLAIVHYEVGLPCASCAPPPPSVATPLYLHRQQVNGCSSYMYTRFNHESQRSRNWLILEAIGFSRIIHFVRWRLHYASLTSSGKWRPGYIKKSRRNLPIPLSSFDLVFKITLCNIFGRIAFMTSVTPCSLVYKTGYENILCIYKIFIFCMIIRIVHITLFDMKNNNNSVILLHIRSVLICSRTDDYSIPFVIAYTRIYAFIIMSSILWIWSTQ